MWIETTFQINMIETQDDKLSGTLFLWGLWTPEYATGLGSVIGIA